MPAASFVKQSTGFVVIVNTAKSAGEAELSFQVGWVIMKGFLEIVDCRIEIARGESSLGRTEVRVASAPGWRVLRARRRAGNRRAKRGDDECR